MTPDFVHTNSLPNAVRARLKSHTEAGPTDLAGPWFREARNALVAADLLAIVDRHRAGHRTRRNHPMEQFHWV